MTMIMKMMMRGATSMFAIQVVFIFLHTAPFQISVSHDSSFIKVRAEKRACFKSLPDILAFNTMRYSFNMVTMMKEKVNVNLIVLIVTTIIYMKTML